MIRGLRGALCLGLLLSAAAAWAFNPQTNGQQKCINKINGDAIKVEAAQAKLGSGCVKDAVKTLSNAETCINADTKGKVSGKVTKTAADQTKQCTAPLPDFAFTSAGTETGAAVQAGKDIMHDAFGSPLAVLLSAGLYSCDTNPDECLCQRQAIDRVVKIFNATNQIFVKCKKAALAIGHLPFNNGASSSADIEDCVTNASTTNGLSVAADPKGKIASATTQLDGTIAKFCNKVPANDEFGGGKCAGLTNANRTVCLAKRVKCRFCQETNTADGLAIDCNAFSGTTCP